MLAVSSLRKFKVWVRRIDFSFRNRLKSHPLYIYRNPGSGNNLRLCDWIGPDGIGTKGDHRIDCHSFS